MIIIMFNKIKSYLVLPKHFLYFLGVKRPPKEFPYKIGKHKVGDASILVAEWQHPSAINSPVSLSNEEIDQLKVYLNPGTVGLDIGANTGGATTIQMGLAAGPSGIIFAFEPNIFAFKILLAAASLNRNRMNIVPLQYAATLEDGEYEFHYSDSNYCNGGWFKGKTLWAHRHFFSLKVQGRNILNLLKSEFPDTIERISYIKIDTEGHDYDIFLSLEEIINQTRPYIRSEIHFLTTNEERTSYFRAIKKMAYRIFYFENNLKYKGIELDESMVMNWEHYDIFAIPEEKC